LEEGKLEKLRGAISGTLFRNDENGYSVISINTQEGLITVTGCLPEFMDGEMIEVEGTWTQHAQYGRQFKVASFSVQKPQTRSAIEKYLGSGLIKGVGPSTARLIVETFGGDTLEVLSEHPERLTEVPKIGRKRMRQIAEGFMAQQASRSTYLFLQRYGISPTLSAKINKLYREHAEDIIRANPYRLIDEVEGVGFLTADRIAQSIGIGLDSEFRMRAGIKYILQDAAVSGGHTCLPQGQLIKGAGELLGCGDEIVETQLKRLLLNKELFSDDIKGDVMTSLPRFRAAETDIAARLLKLTSASQQMFTDHIKSRIRDFEKTHGIRFSKTQRQAIQIAAQSGLSVITGGPGTGKTTLINCVLHVLGAGTKALLAAPTGRAAKRMSEACGGEASTIHRLLQYGGEEGTFQVNQENPLDCDCVILDEVSMMDIFLMHSLLQAIQPGTRLLLVGDADQLPSVGPGNVLADILMEENIPQVRLTEIFRQAGGSMIVLNAHLINQGEAPQMNGQGSDFFFEYKSSADEAAESIVALCTKRLPSFLGTAGNERGIQVLSPTRKGVCGVLALNIKLQAAINPPSPAKAEVAYGEMTLREGDKVMHVKNNYLLQWATLEGTAGQGVFNGDIGYIQEIEREDKLIKVIFDEERLVQYEYMQLEELELAYCLSVHKSQGSEFPAVIIPMVGGPRMLLTRNLLYTGITRARQLVVLVGRQEVLHMMVQNNQERRRYSALSHWLKVRAGRP
jgi:exodeoxyribonuclease V alpha subunit